MVDESSDFRFSPRENRADEISWRSWSPRAFAQAREQGKLILLSISAVWCHWCHVMDENTYSDSRVISRINDDFIPVRVDSDRRPDINRRYNQGGWPTTAFLTPSGRLVAGLTYAPPERLLGLLERLSALYRGRRELIDSEVVSIAADEQRARSTLRSEGEVDESIGDDVLKAILGSWDREFGGLGGEPKFPAPDAIEFTLGRYLVSGEEELRSLVVSTLDGMVTGEVWDEVEGGFFRYATGRDWSAPHYEKMLSDNADLVSLYLHASVALGRDDYRDAAARAIDYVLNDLMDDALGGFYGSQDADEAYYRLDAEGRVSREAPLIDRTIYTDSSSRMISALVLASAVLEREELLERARVAADLIWESGYRDGAGVAHYLEGPGAEPHLWGQPGDQVFHLGALLDLYQLTGEDRYLERARQLGDLLVSIHVRDAGWLGEATGQLTSLGDSAGNMGGVDIPDDGPDILINGHGARTLLILAALSHDNGYRECALGILKFFSGLYGGYSYHAAGYALAADLYRMGPVEVKVSDDGPGGEAINYRGVAARYYSPRKVVDPRPDMIPPASADRGEPPVVVCYGERCIPVHSPGELPGVLSGAMSGK